VLLNAFWLSLNMLCGWLPMFFTVKVTKQNCPCAVALRYWRPTVGFPHSTLETVNSNLPSRTGWFSQRRLWARPWLETRAGSHTGVEGDETHAAKETHSPW
jgi:hypothetical protein